MPPPVDFNLYLITDRRQVVSGNLIQTVRAALEGGVRAVQLREKDLSPDELLPLAERLRDLTRAYRARLLINSDIDVALAVAADGVHLPCDSSALASARRRLGPDRLLGVSTHNQAEIEAAVAAKADFMTFGPVFATASKLPFGAPVGIAALQGACRQSPMPVFALGGISVDRLDQLPSSGIAGVALIGGIMAASDPTQAARGYLTALAVSSPREKK